MMNSQEPHPDPGRVGSAALDEAQIEALRDVPKGAVALGGIAVLLLLAAWVLIYSLIYLPRGMVG